MLLLLYLILLQMVSIGISSGSSISCISVQPAITPIKINGMANFKQLFILPRLLLLCAQFPGTRVRSTHDFPTNPADWTETARS